MVSVPACRDEDVVPLSSWKKWRISHKPIDHAIYSEWYSLRLWDRRSAGSRSRLGM